MASLRTLYGPVFLLVMLCAGCLARSSQQGIDQERPMRPLKSWEYRASTPSDSTLPLSAIISSGGWEPLASIEAVPREPAASVIWLKTTLPRWDEADPVLYLGQVNFPIQVFLNGTLLHETGTIAYSAPVIQGWQQILFRMPPIREGDVLLMRVQTSGAFTGLNNEALLTSYQTVILAILNANARGLVLSIVFLTLGIITLVTFFILHRLKLLWGCSAFLLSLSGFILANSTFLQLSVHAPLFFYTADYITFILTTAGGFYAIEQALAEPYKIAARWSWKMQILLLIVVLAVVNTTRLFWIDLLPYCLAVLSVSMLITASVMARSARRGDRESKILFAGFAGIFLFALVEIALFSLFDVHTSFGYNVRVLDYGALIFAGSLIWIAVSRYASAERQKADAQRKELDAAKDAARAQQEFTRKLIESQENERSRIAQELHDSIGQKLLLMKNMLTAAERTAPPDGGANLNRMGSLTRETIQEIRSISYNLRPQYLEQLGLTATIQALIESIQDLSPIRFQLQCDTVDNVIPHEHEINFFRIVQEGLNNIIKHSGATEASVSIRLTDGAIHLEIRDNGVGIRRTPSHNGMGLRGMQERAHILGGTLAIEPLPQGGTSLRVFYPLARTTV